MATVSDLIEDAMGKLGVLQVGQGGETAVKAVWLRELQRMLGRWANIPELQYTSIEGNFSTAGTTASYTIGTGQTWNTSIPIVIEQAWIRVSNEDYPVEVVKRRAYKAIQNKTTAGRPKKLYFDRGPSTGTVYVWPTPSAIETIYLDMRKAIATYTATTDSVSLPSGYEDLIVWALALAMVPHYLMANDPRVPLIKEQLRDSMVALGLVTSPLTLSGYDAQAPQDRGMVRDEQQA